MSGVYLGWHLAVALAFFAGTAFFATVAHLFSVFGFGVIVAFHTAFCFVKLVFGVIHHIVDIVFCVVYESHIVLLIITD